MNHLKKLKQIVGKSHLHDQKQIVITDYEVDEEGLHLQVTKEGKPTEMLVPIRDAHDFFDKLLPVDGSSSSSLTMYESQQQSLSAMRKQLMELNTKLMGPDAEKYIKQAKAVNNNINTLINSLKLEFQVAKEMKRNQ